MALQGAVIIIASDKKTPGIILAPKNGEIREIVVIQKAERGIILVNEEIVVLLNVDIVILANVSIAVLVIVESNTHEITEAAIIEIKGRDLGVIQLLLNEIAGNHKEENHLQFEETLEENKTEEEDPILMIPEQTERDQFLHIHQLHTHRILAKETPKHKDETQIYLHSVQVSCQQSL